MPHECSIIRVTYGETEYGGESQTRQTISKGIKCFVQNAKIDEISRYQKREIDVETKIYFLDEPDLKEGDFVYITKNNKGLSYVGQTFEFMSIDDATAGHGIAWKGMFSRETNPVQPVTGT